MTRSPHTIPRSLRTRSRLCFSIVPSPSNKPHLSPTKKLRGIWKQIKGKKGAKPSFVRPVEIKTEFGDISFSCFDLNFLQLLLFQVTCNLNSKGVPFFLCNLVQGKQLLLGDKLVLGKQLSAVSQQLDVNNSC